MKTNIKSKKFYAEAESMEVGWGRYLESIDKLKDAVERQDCISLKEACWILYGEGFTSGIWQNFKIHCTKKGWRTKKMPWEAWKGLFDHWYEQGK